jgi:general secretion pathway protein K
MRAHTPRFPPHRQRGMVAILAIFIVALASSTAIYLLWQHTVMIRQLENVAARAQIREIARAGTAWAAAILAQDNAQTDNLLEPWAQPLPPVAVEQATLEGGLFDEQAKFNLNNLVGANGQPSAPDVQAFQQLLAGLGIDPSLANAIIDWIDPDQSVTSPGGAEDSYYLGLDPPYRPANAMISSLGELRLIRGFSPELVDRLSPFVTALPSSGVKLNVNTMSSGMFAALIPEVSPDTLVGAQPFTTRNDFLKLLTDEAQNRLTKLIDVKSSFFSAQAEVVQGRTTIRYRAILQRSADASTWPAVLSLTEEPM